MSYLLSDQEHPGDAWGVLTGDSLFVNSAGRPDLLGSKTDKLVGQLFHTLRDFYLGLPDSLAPGTWPSSHSLGVRTSTI